MSPLLLVAALAAEPTTPSESATGPGDAPATAQGDAAPPRKGKGGWLSKIRYGIGVSSHLGGGSDGTAFGRHLIAEPAAFELRSFLWPRFAFHTTLYIGRMIAPAVQDRDGRIDYGCHLAGHIPVAEGRTLVVAPGADIAYSFTGSGYQRFTGDVRFGVDVERGRWSTGFYVRPYVGWWRDVGAERGQVAGGAFLEFSNVFVVPKRGERVRETDGS